MEGEWSTSRPGRFTPGNSRKGGPQMYPVCGVTTLHCDSVSEKALCTCARRVLHSTGSGRFIHIQVSCYLLTAPSASSNYACPPRRKPMVPTQSLRFALETTCHFQQVRRHLSHSLYTVYYTVLFLSFEPEIRVNNTRGAASSVRREFVRLLSWVRNSQHFVEPGCSLPCSQKPATFSDRLQINPVQHSHLISLRSILILSSHLRLGHPNGLSKYIENSIKKGQCTYLKIKIIAQKKMLLLFYKDRSVNAVILRIIKVKK